MSIKSKRGTTRSDASLLKKSGCACFCSSKKGEVRLHENAKGSRRCTKALCESLLSNNVTAAPLFQFQPPHTIIKLLVRVSPVGVTREVPVKHEHHLNNFKNKIYNILRQIIFIII